MSVVAVLGLGYVGLPLVVEFGKLGRTIGFDIVTEKVAKCRAGTDPSREIPDAEMALAVHAEYTSEPGALAEADFIIVAVPTPVRCLVSYWQTTTGRISHGHRLPTGRDAFSSAILRAPCRSASRHRP